jgi:hypothetical protein
VEIFRAWLRKYIKEDKRMKGKVLAALVGVSAQQMSYYHSGRVDNGVRSFPNIPYKIRTKILETTDTSREEMLELGGQELLSVKQGPDLFKAVDKLHKDMEEIKDRVEQHEAEKANKIENFEDRKNAKHHNIIDEFNDQELATEINTILVKIEKKSRRGLKKMLKVVKAELEDLEEAEIEEQEAAQKKASNESAQ